MGINQQTNRRGMDGFGPLGPSLERQKRRTAERKQRLTAELARKGFDQPPAAAVERIG